MSRKKSRPEDSEAGATQQPERLESVIEQIGPEYLEASAKRVRRRDLEEVTDSSREILARFREAGALQRHAKDAETVVGLLRDYCAGRYDRASLWTLSLLTFALQYVLKPIDIIPDNLPVIGQLDDAVVFSQCVAMVRADLRDYELWKLADDIAAE